jgi:hypothetical protein
LYGIIHATYAYRYRRNTEGAAAIRGPRDPLKPLLRMRVALLAATLSCAVASVAGARTETIGTWKLTCRDDRSAGGCSLQHKDASVRIGTYSVALEVQSVNGALVPVVAVGGVPTQNAVGSLVSVAIGLRLNNGPWFELPCGTDLRCVPSADELPALALTFPSDGQMRLRLEVVVPGAGALPQPEHEFDLIGTRLALDRLRSAGPITTAAPGASVPDWKAMMQKMWRAVGG